MKVIDNPIVIASDCDETLLHLIIDEEDREQYDEKDIITLTKNGVTKEYVINRKIVENLRRHRQQGHEIWLWSGAGGLWAAYVAKQLGIDDIVDTCLTKVKYCYDDASPSSWMAQIYHPFPKKGIPQS